MSTSRDGVEELYTEYPYPAHGVISDVVARMVAGPLRALQERLGRKKLRLLDAGCGTGEQTLGVARALPELEVVGIDRNEASLTMARELGERSGIAARFEARDLTQSIEGLGTFDLVVSVGTLHHLEKPAVGLATLRAVAADHAGLVGMVYGTFGRRETFIVRDLLALICGDGAPRRQRLEVLASSRLASDVGPMHYLQTLQRRLRFGPSIPVTEALRRALRGRSQSYQADAYTHVQETAFTWSELAATLEQTGWRFRGWPRRSGMPDRPEQVLTGPAVELVRRQPMLRQAAVYERLVRPANLYFIAEGHLVPRHSVIRALFVGFAYMMVKAFVSS